MGKSLAELTKIISEFCDKRGWDNLNPSHLVNALFLETAELADHFQWQDNFKMLSEDEKREVGYEFVDVMFYLLRLAQRSGIDIEQAFDEKLPKLELKFPQGADGNERHKLYRKTGKNRTYD